MICLISMGAFIPEPGGSMKRYHRLTAICVSATRQGFNTLELLVTVGIIIVLCALLLPVLNNAREKAKRVKCQEVLHQVYLNTILYASDHEDHMPPGVFSLRATPFRPFAQVQRLV